MAKEKKTKRVEEKPSEPAKEPVGFFGLAAKPHIQRILDDVASRMAQSQGVQRFARAMDPDTRVAADRLFASLGSVIQVTKSHLVNDLVDTATNRFARDANLTALKGKKVMADDVQKKIDGLRKSLERLPVLLVEGDDGVFRLPSCPDFSDVRKRKITLEEAEGMGFDVHDCQPCSALLLARKQKVADAIARLEGEAEGATPGKDKEGKSLVELTAKCPEVLEAIVDRVNRWYHDDERAEVQFLVMFHTNSLVEARRLADARSKAEFETLLGFIKQRSFPATVENLARGLGRALGIGGGDEPLDDAAEDAAVQAEVNKGKAEGNALVAAIKGIFAHNP